MCVCVYISGVCYLFVPIFSPIPLSSRRSVVSTDSSTFAILVPKTSPVYTRPRYLRGFVRYPEISARRTLIFHKDLIPNYNTETMLVSSILSFLAVTAASLATCSPTQSKQTSPAAPATKYLFTVNVSSPKAYVLGDTPAGQRVFEPITGGNFSGPAAHGTSVSLLLSLIGGAGQTMPMNYGPQETGIRTATGNGKPE